MKTLVVGIGNPDRGDDGIGSLVLRCLSGRLPPEVALRTRTGDMLALLDDWAGYDCAICVDATEAGGNPGHVHRFDLTNQDLPRGLSFLSSHAMGLVDAVALARTLGLAPARIIVYGIEGLCFDGGAAMTRAVADAAPVVAQHVMDDVRQLAPATANA